MDKKDEAVIDVALRLTGTKEFDSNGCWDIAPPNWSCPVCKRSKMHIARPNQSGILQGHLHNHHDHISSYAKDKAKFLINENEDYRELNEREWWFVHNKISTFLNRFEKTLVCQDCNNADAKAKSILKDVCSYLSFTPKEISSFIIPEAHKSHKIEEGKVREMCSDINNTHSYRKSLCDTLLSRMFINDRMWGEQQNAPCIDHYKAANAILKNSEKYEATLLLDLKHKSDTNLRYLSIAVEKHEKRKHKKSNKIHDWTEKSARKERLEETRTKNKKLLEAGAYPNHGKLWEQSDLKKLVEGYEKGKSIKELSTQFGRMEKSIESRLRKLGCNVE